jgi:molecular chaperone DnaK
LLELIDEKYKSKIGSNHDVTPSDLRGKTVEELKKSLSTRDNVKAGVEPEGQPRENIEITREEFEAKIGTLITKAEMLFEAALGEAGLSASSLDHVVLVGGSTRVPAVRNSVESMVGKPALATKNVDEVVARGAALYAGLKADNVPLTEAQQGAISQIDLNEVCNHFYGTIILARDTERQTDEEKVAILIKKNTSIPLMVTESYFTVQDGQQSVLCTVTQSVTEETDPRWVTRVKEVDLGPLPANRPAGKEVRVSYSYDENQVMHCFFEDVESGIKQEIRIDLSSEAANDAAADIDKFLVE